MNRDNTARVDVGQIIRLYDQLASFLVANPSRVVRIKNTVGGDILIVSAPPLLDVIRAQGERQ